MTKIFKSNITIPIITATGGDVSNSSIKASGYNQHGGTGYHGFLQLTNTYGSATNPNKYFRLNSVGAIEIVDSSYSNTILSLSNAGALNILSSITAASIIKSGGTSAQYLMADGSTTTGSATTSMNYAQTQSTKQSSISASGVTIVSTSLTTGGNPVQVLVTGDAENSNAGGWVKLQLYRDSTAIGKIVHVESSAASENIPYALTVIDTPAAGTYTYALKTVSVVSTGTMNFGETDGPVLTAIELNTLTPTVNVSLTGNATANQVISTNNGNGTNFKVGDDAWIGDVNSANTISVKGQQSATLGYIKFGGDTNSFGYNGTNLVYGTTVIPSSATLLTSASTVNASTLNSQSPSYYADHIIPYTKSGTLSVTTGTLRYRLPWAATIIATTASVNTAPTGASIIVDVLKNGTTIYSTTANRPTIAATNFATTTSPTPDVTSLSAGDYLTVNISQVGSTIAGSDLSVFIEIQRA